jgi:hypothetical protein
VRLTIPLSDASSDALRRLASREYRDTRMQAKFLLEQAIRERATQEATTSTDDQRLTRSGSPDPLVAA